MDEDFNKLLVVAKDAIGNYQISRMMKFGRVASALITNTGRIYIGVCIETKCSLGMCAEKNAICNMIANGDTVIKKICTINDEGQVMPPCGACREFMIQMGPKAKEIQVLITNDGQIATLDELMPHYPYI